MMDVSERIERDRVVDLLQSLVRIPSQFSEFELVEHADIIRFLTGELSSLGMDVAVVGSDPDYPCVVGRLPGSDGSPALAMIGHYNTVMAGDPALWSVDPFSAEIVDGNVYGRGACDQKNGIAAAISATRALVDAGIQLKGDLVHLWLPGEGAQQYVLPYLIDVQRDLIDVDWFLDTDGGPAIVQRSGGLIWIEIEVRGLGSHVGLARPGGVRPVNAISKMMKLLAAMEDVDSWMTYEPHPLFGPPERYSTAPIVEVGKISGGVKVNQVPEGCLAQVDIRMLPGQFPEQVLGELQELIDRLRMEDPELEVEVRPYSVYHVPKEIARDHLVARAIRRVAGPFLGQEPAMVGSIGGGRPELWSIGDVISFGCFGEGGNAHAIDEHASIEAMVTCARIYARLLVDLLG
jgi:acetylornithine deacetylase/succinyl-diaminopimelate desuccinylase-like protein